VSELLTALKVSNKEIIYKELKLKQYKTILKCLYTDPIDIPNLILNLNNILTLITNLTIEEISNLNLLEYLFILTEIRITSIGSSIFAVHNNSNKPVNIEIPLNKTRAEILKCIEDFVPLLYKDANTTLNFSIPFIKDLTDKEFLFVNEEVNNLPVRYLKIIKNYTKKINSFFNSYYFFNPGIKEFNLKLSLNKYDYIQLIKILFNENLLSIYDNLFYLSKICNMSSEYLENGTYGEFKVFVKKTEEMLQKQIKQPPVVEQSNESDQFDPVDINSLYGNDTPINITPSEFTP
jgi:hypothetical protein